VVAGDAVSSTTPVGTYTVTYNVVDSEGLAAVEVTRIVEVVAPELPVCNDGLDNDNDGLIDSEDPNCHTDGDPENPESYDPEDDNEDNTKPVITLLGDNPVVVYIGGSYSDQGATAADIEDGDITEDIATDLGGLDVGVVGNYTITYTVSDSEGLAADPVTRVVEVRTSGGGGGGGGGGGNGGGGIIPTAIVIFNEAVEYVGNGEAVVTWNTNVPATSQVVYDDDSHSAIDIPDYYGYEFLAPETLDLVTTHSMSIFGLTDGIPYYFRPVSDNVNVAEVVGVEVTYGQPAPQTGGGSTTIAPEPAFPAVESCSYLLEFIKLGDVNSAIEVEKLERFLNTYEGESLAVNGVYEAVDFAAVERFQEKYRNDILGPWGHEAPTGYVYLTTKKKVNEIYCERPFPLSLAEESEIDAFRAILQALAVGEPIDELLEEANLSEFEAADLIGRAEDAAANLAAGASDANRIETESLLADLDLETTDDAEVLAGVDQNEASSSVVASARNFASAAATGALNFAVSNWILILLVLFAGLLVWRIRKLAREEEGVN
jgi:hypothetical protein